MPHGAHLGPRLRAAALLVLGALALHQARYLLPAGAGGEAAPGEAGHGYLTLLAPLLIAVAAAAIVVSVLAPAIHRRLPHMSDPGASTERAAGFAAALLAIFVAQEVCEGLATGSAEAIAAAFAGPGGWLLLPLAIVFGALAEGASRCLQRAELRVATVFARAVTRAPRRVAVVAAPPCAPLCARPLAFGLSRRPPPPLTV